ncbi:hypothetical protein O6H91_06G135200 [Diphasiastrum complanatum]|uniref:Uncharacterized protein n=1 Tax=Diphasiastrum complanatum TaxID=34168 RepID=A0ACC2DJ48_DIPCM|nr:hypothetical protein O6H91_06G135200 [Diphasiastrum complanatum]
MAYHPTLFSNVLNCATFLECGRSNPSCITSPDSSSSHSLPHMRAKAGTAGLRKVVRSAPLNSYGCNRDGFSFTDRVCEKLHPFPHVSAPNVSILRRFLVVGAFALLNLTTRCNAGQQLDILASGDSVISETFVGLCNMAFELGPKPPSAKKVKHVLELFGDVREDYYYWLRDDARQNPDVLAHLQQENAYTEGAMSDTSDLQELLYKEMRGRIKEEDSSVPLRKGPYFYYTKNLEGKQYKIHCRRAIYGGEGPGSFDEVMTPETAGPEEVLLDENEKALQSEFFIVQAVKVSPNHRRVAYNVDTKGDEFYTIHVFDIESKKLVGKPVIGATEQVEWVDDDTLVYVTQDDTRRPYKAWRHELHTEQSQDVCLYHEEDEEYFLDIISSESEEYLFVLSGSKMTSFILYMKKNSPAKELRYLTQRIKGIDTIATHRGGHFFIKQRSEDAFNSELLICPIEDVSKTSILIPHRERYNHHSECFPYIVVAIAIRSIFHNFS